jgi:iron complex outermembrane receptor protein
VEAGQQLDDRRNFDNLDGERGDLALDQQEDVLNLGSYLSGEVALPGEITLSAAVRVDEVRFDVEDRFLADGNDSGAFTFQEVSPSAGIRWRPDPEIMFYGNVATSFETPTTTEFDNPDGGGFNPALESQTARSVELGMKGEFPDDPWRPSFDLAVFTIDVDDALVPYELEAFPGREFFRNAGSSVRNGLEAAVRLMPTDSLSVDLTYTWSDFSYDRFETPSGDFRDNRLPGVPEHAANLRLDYQSTAGGFVIWNTRFVGALQADDANTTEVASTHVSDLRLGWQRTDGRWTVESFAGLNNLFDQDYAANIRINAFGGRYYEPAPTRNLYAGLRLRAWF